jgi:uncharacterized membrane protein
MKTLLILFIGFLSLISWIGAAEYRVVDLGELSLMWDEPWRPLRINDTGQAAGTGPQFPGDFSGFVWQDGARNYLADVSPVNWANGININAVVAGAEYDGAINTYPVYWQDNINYRLPTPVTAKNGEALAINGLGTLAGYVFSPTVSQYAQAVLWANGATGRVIMLIPKLSPDDSFNYVMDINDSDVAVGYSGNLDIERQYAFLYQPGQSPAMLIPLAGDTQSAAEAVNNFNRIAGYSATLSGPMHAVLWKDAIPASLVSLDVESWANALNDLDQVVGGYVTEAGISAFIWENGQMVDVNTQLIAGAGWKLSEAYDINNEGWIVGSGTAMDASQSPTIHGLLLVPVEQETVLTAAISFTPGSINLKSNAPSINCFISLPPEYTVQTVNTATIRLQENIQPDSVQIDIVQQIIQVKFLISKIRPLLTSSEAELTVTGELTDGTKFQGINKIGVKNNTASMPGRK